MLCCQNDRKGSRIKESKRSTGMGFNSCLTSTSSHDCGCLLQRSVQEKRILQKISHPFCVSLHFAFQDEQKLYLVMNYVGGGNFKFYLRQLKRFPEEHVRFYGAEITTVFEYLHSNMILFRDLKLENMIDSSIFCYVMYMYMYMYIIFTKYEF